MKNGNRNVKVWAMGVAMIAATAALSAQQTAAPQTPSNVQVVVPKQVEKYTVGQAKPPAASDKPLRDMTLEEAEQIALEKNLDLQVAKLNPLIQDYNLVSARAAFLPTLTGSFTQTHQSNPVTSTNDGAATSIIGQTQNYSTGSQPDHAVVGWTPGVDVHEFAHGEQQHQEHPQPDIPGQPSRQLHAAAAGRLQDRRDANAVEDVGNRPAGR